MNVSVIIPTRPIDDGTAARCVASVESQLGRNDEIIVSADGIVEPGAFAGLGRARLVTGPRVGPGGARNRALAVARNPLILFLNDDVIAHDGLIEHHRAAHAGRATDGQPPALVLGAAPWHRFDDDRVIDRLVRDTSMIFFYDRMDTNDPEHDWGFRHAWTLNLSMPASIVPRFDERLGEPMFDDLEWAFRTQLSHGAAVLYSPEAAVTHIHRYEPLMLLRREALLGHQALALTRISPGCGQAVFGDRFCGDPSSVRAHEENTCNNTDDARDRFAQLCAHATLPSSTVTRQGLADLFEASRAWRDVARSIGFLAAVHDGDAKSAQQRATQELHSAHQAL